MNNELKPRLIDSHFAAFLGQRSGLTGEKRERFQQLIQDLNMGMAEGHSCLLVSGENCALLQCCSLVSDGSASDTPLVLHDNRLYLHRFFLYESRLAAQLKLLADKEHTYPEVDIELLLDKVFGSDSDEIDWQKRAAEVALCKSLCIISGGPGTGKTTTVVKIIALFLQVLGKDLRIAMAAPTGKAAMRLQESIENSIDNLSFDKEVVSLIPTSASTIHRLLGVIRNSPQFRHNGHNPLGLDVVIVDEASMVDLALMSKLVDALRPDARLILLGDKDQLASVESGAVLNDCIRSLPDNTVELKKSYRFDSGIKSLATAINAGDGEAAWSVLTDSGVGNVTILRNSYFRFIGERFLDYMRVVMQGEQLSLKERFAAFNRFRVLCAKRHGSFGVERVNRSVESCLKAKGYSHLNDIWYEGRPVMVTANDYSLQLFNGDVGICFKDPEDGVMKVWFEQGEGNYKKCLPYRIPRCETVFAMTIHKSQGSEFREVLVLLPDDESRLLNRQLVYTAVTRAKEFVHVVASKKILVYALQSDYPRYSGLSEMIA